MRSRLASATLIAASAIAVCSAGSARAATVAVAACTYAVPQKTALGGGLTLLQVTPDGVFGPNDGREDAGPWRIDAASAQAVIDRFRARAQPPVIDYEHQTLYREKNGQPAPAAGWIRELRWIDGQGLFALAELTKRAGQAIADKEYLYFSPVFEYDTETGTVLAVHMGALTNTPAINGMEPLSLVAAASAAFLPRQEHPPVNPLLKALLIALGLPESTTEEAATAALTALGPLQNLQARASVATAACTALNLQADASPEAVTAACTSLRTASQEGAPDPAKFVPVETVTALQTQIAALTARQQDADVEALVAPALADGRLLPAMEQWARDLGKKDLAALTAFLKTAPPVAALTGTQTRGKPPGGTASGDQQLSADELAVCSAMGIAPEAYRKAHTALATGAAA